MSDDNRSVLTILENALDMVLNFSAFISAYIIIYPLIETPSVLLNNSKTQFILFVSVVVSSLVYQLFNLYKPIPYVNANYSVSGIILANVLFFGFSLLGAAVVFHDERLNFIIVWIIVAAILSTVLLVFKKRVIIFVVRLFRKRRDIVKKVIIIGDNRETARAFIRAVIGDAHNSIMIVGCVGGEMTDVGCESLGELDGLGNILERYKPDYAVFAVDGYDKNRLIELVNLCDDRCIKVYFLPVISGFFKSPKQIERIGSIPLINVHTTPLDNRTNAFIKRAVDIVGACILIVLSSPLMAVAAVGVKMSSPGPILFKQTRVGKMGEKFTILKFRSMRVNSESNIAWTTNGDVRKTRFGTFLRRSSIDELPQLFNVLLGTMSLVGPRPELPVFVEHFKSQIPLYMVKHYVKPGITGLAQIKGLRGDTSVEERIQEDIAYIENWSLFLDFLILIKTPFKAFNKNEKYVDSRKDDRLDEQ